MYLKNENFLLKTWVDLLAEPGGGNSVRVLISTTKCSLA